MSFSSSRLGSQTARLANGNKIRWHGWNVVVGIEVHTQLKTKHKLFSKSLSPQVSNIAPNEAISLFDAAYPGSLPILNNKSVELAIRASVALNADIQKVSSFDRKHYFYGDLPSGYQITQNYAPLARNGYLVLESSGKRIGIKQIQLEQDTAKSSTLRDGTIQLDLNRAGVPLIEIVSNAEMESPEEAGEYVKTLQSLLRSIGASDGNMEEGSLRCDVNVSVRRDGEELGRRTEVKNLNSVKAVMMATTVEAQRQMDILITGGQVTQETRGFDEDSATTFSLRSKEDVEDYRYMPDPNIPPLVILPEVINQVVQRMPETRDKIKHRLTQEYGIPLRDAEVLLSLDAGKVVGLDGEGAPGVIAYMEQVRKETSVEPKIVSNWIIHELLGQLAFRSETFQENRLHPSRLSSILNAIHEGRITGPSGKIVLRHLLDHPEDQDVSILIEKLGLSKSQSDELLETWCDEVIQRFPKEVDLIKKQKKLQILDKLVGAVMKLSHGGADPKKTRELLEAKLGTGRG